MDRRMLLPDRFVAIAMDIVPGRPEMALSLGAILVADDQILGKWSWLIKPPEIPPAEVLSSLSLSWRTLSAQLPFGEIWRQLWTQAFATSGAKAIVSYDPAEEQAVRRGCASARIAPPTLPWPDVAFWAERGFPHDKDRSLRAIVDRYQLPWSEDDGPQERAHQVAQVALCLCPDHMLPPEHRSPDFDRVPALRVIPPAPPEPSALPPAAPVAAEEQASAAPVAPVPSPPDASPEAPPPPPVAPSAETSAPPPAPATAAPEPQAPAPPAPPVPVALAAPEPVTLPLAPLAFPDVPAAPAKRRGIYQHLALLTEEVALLRERLGEEPPRTLDPSEIARAHEAGKRYRETRGAQSDGAFLEAARWEQAARHFWLGWFEANDLLARR